MKAIQNIKNKLFSIKSSSEFNEIALIIFYYQFKHNPIYEKYVNLLSIDPHSLTEYSQIPFLPIEFFKTQKIITGENNPEIIFSSSGTTGMELSKHHVTDMNLYDDSLLEGFKYFYGNVENYCIIALLPSYKKDSSLIYMVKKLIEKSKNKNSGFYSNNQTLIELLKNEIEKNTKIFLIGVSFALLDLVETNNFYFPDAVIMETGGMKGKRKEMIRSELHQILKKSFGVKSIHSEYGMTELLSQAYSKADGIFRCPPWMKVFIRDMYDPLSFVANGRNGGINIIDLANINSCSFIETKDIGRSFDAESFEVLGRFDNSDIRGCNLLITND